MELNELLAGGLALGASDLHLSAGLPPMVRVDGELRPLAANKPASDDSPATMAPADGDLHMLVAGKQTSDASATATVPVDGDLRMLGLQPLTADAALALVQQAMPSDARAAFDDLHEYDGALAVPEVGRLRVNAFQHARGPGAVFRYIPSQPPSLEALGLGETFKALAARRQGLIAVTGPTGSGKSTTLAALVDHINGSSARHLLTIEDPIEFVHQSKRCVITQREVHSHTRSFGAALRAALREDPDVILVGELRDLETIRLALEAAETGHLVLATLHTASAAKTIDRIIEVFPAGEKALVRALASEALAAVVAQTLVRKPGGGRVAAHEIMVCTPAIRNLIREGKTAQLQSAIQTGGRHGMQTLEQALAQLAAAGTITQEAAANHAR